MDNGCACSTGMTTSFHKDFNHFGVDEKSQTGLDTSGTTHSGMAHNGTARVNKVFLNEAADYGTRGRKNKTKKNSRQNMPCV